MVISVAHTRKQTIVLRSALSLKCRQYAGYDRQKTHQGPLARRWIPRWYQAAATDGVLTDLSVLLLALSLRLCTPTSISPESWPPSSITILP